MSARTCTTCAAEVSADARFCTTCGATLAVPAGEPPPIAPATMNPRTTVNPRTSGLAITALVLGILSFAIWFFGLVTAPIAVVFGIIANGAVADRPDEVKGRGFALAGIILGIVWMSLATIVVAAMLAFTA